MKTRLVLSLSLAALVATSASAFAQEPPAPPPAPAPPAEPTPPPPTPPSTPPSNVGNGDTPAPNVVTVGTQTARRDEVKSDANKKAPPSPKSRPWAGTQIFTNVSASVNTLAPGIQQSANPTADYYLLFQPRYEINKSWQLRGRATFNYEFTNSDGTATKNEPRFGDAAVQLFYRSIPAFAGIKPMLGAQLMFPISSESRARTMIVSPALVAQLVKPVEKVLGGELLFLMGATYSHPFYTNTTSGIRGERPYPVQCSGGNGCNEQLSGAANPSDVFSWTALVAGEWGKWSPAVFMLMSHQGVYKFRDIEGVKRIDDPSTFRQTTYFSAWLDYNANDFLTAEVGYYMSRSLINDNGTYGNPFWDRHQDMRLYLGANVNLDNLAKRFEGGAREEGGVVRAKNTRGPVLNF